MSEAAEAALQDGLYSVPILIGSFLSLVAASIVIGALLHEAYTPSIISVASSFIFLESTSSWQELTFNSKSYVGTQTVWFFGSVS